MSGGAFSSQGLPLHNLAESSEMGAKFATETLSARTLADLRAIPAQKLLDAATNDKAVRFAPNIDGYFLPESVEAIFAEAPPPDRRRWRLPFGWLGLLAIACVLYELTQSPAIVKFTGHL